MYQGQRKEAGDEDEADHPLDQRLGPSLDNGCSALVNGKNCLENGLHNVYVGWREVRGGRNYLNFNLHIPVESGSLYTDDTTLTASPDISKCSNLQLSLTNALHEVEKWANAK